MDENETGGTVDPKDSETLTQTNGSKGKAKQAKQGGTLSAAQQLRQIFTGVTFAHPATAAKYGPNRSGTVSHLIGVASVKVGGMLTTETTIYKKVHSDGSKEIAITDLGFKPTNSEFGAAYAGYIAELREKFLLWLEKEAQAGRRPVEGGGSSAGRLTPEQAQRLGL